FLYDACPPRHLHSFPTRRSSDLGTGVGLPAVAVRVPPDAQPATKAIPRNPAAATDRCRMPDLLFHEFKDQRGAGIALVAGCASGDRKSTRLNSSHVSISYAVFCL